MNGYSSSQCSQDKLVFGSQDPIQLVDGREDIFLRICRGSSKGELWGRVLRIEVTFPRIILALLKDLITWVSLPSCYLLRPSFPVLLTRLPRFPLTHFAFPLGTLFPPDLLGLFKHFKEVRSHHQTLMTIEVEKKCGLSSMSSLTTGRIGCLKRAYKAISCLHDGQQVNETRQEGGTIRRGIEL